MKNSKLVSLVLMIIVSLSIVLVAKEVFAADPGLNLNAITGGDNTSSTRPADDDNTATVIGGGNSTSRSGNTQNIQNIQNTQNVRNTSVLNTNNIINNTTNSSIPKTGVESSTPAVLLVVVLGITGIYAYKKVQEYKNI